MMTRGLVASAPAPLRHGPPLPVTCHCANRHSRALPVSQTVDGFETAAGVAV